jgi:hypothetical protein
MFLSGTALIANLLAQMGGQLREAKEINGYGKCNRKGPERLRILWGRIKCKAVAVAMGRYKGFCPPA